MLLHFSIVLIILPVFSKTVNEQKIFQQGRILNGAIASPGQFPYAVQIIVYFSSPEGGFEAGCTGSLITEYYILSAGHCVAEDPGTRVSEIKIFVGSTRNKRGEQYRIKRYCAMFTPNDVEKDMSLMEVDRPVKLSQYVQTIALSGAQIFPGTRVVVPGWGRVGESPAVKADKLFFMTGRYHGKRSEFVGFISQDKTYKLCYGDSGGPFVTPRGEQIGLLQGPWPITVSKCASAQTIRFSLLRPLLSWIHKIATGGTDETCRRLM